MSLKKLPVIFDNFNCVQTSSKRFQNMALKYKHRLQNKLNSFSVEQHTKYE